MPPSLHAILGASSAKRWLTCTPSARLGARLTERFGQKESVFAREGTLGHALAETKVRYAYYRADGMDAKKHSEMDALTDKAYIGINKFRYEALRAELGDVPEDMEKGADSYCDVVMEKYISAKDADKSARILLEQRLDYSDWVPSGFGTGDCIIVSDSLLEIADLKMGKGIPVDAHNNPQLRLYALGAHAAFGDLYDYDKVRMTIIQPRLDNVSEETIPLEELLRWAQDEVVEKAKLAWAGKGEFVVGEHCRFCPAKAICAKRVSEAMKAFSYGFESAGLIPDEQIPDILPLLDTAEEWIKEIKEYAETQALHGQRWRGFKLVHGKKPNRAWSDPEEVRAQLLRAGYAPAQFEKTTLKPVGEIEKAMGKVAFRSIVGSLVTQGAGRLILVSEDDKRQEYSSNEAAFSDMEIN